MYRETRYKKWIDIFWKGHKIRIYFIYFFNSQSLISSFLSFYVSNVFAYAPCRNPFRSWITFDIFPAKNELLSRNFLRFSHWIILESLLNHSNIFSGWRNKFQRKLGAYSPWIRRTHNAQTNSIASHCRLINSIQESLHGWAVRCPLTGCQVISTVSKRFSRLASVQL